MKRQCTVFLTIIIAFASLFGSVSRVAAIDIWEGGPYPVSATFSCSGLVNFEIDWGAGDTGETVRVEIMTPDSEMLETQYVSLHDRRDRTSFSVQMNPESWSTHSTVSWNGLFAKVSGSFTDYVTSESRRCLKPGETDPSSGLVVLESATRQCADLYSQVDFLVRNTDVKDAQFSWAITTAAGTVVQTGTYSEVVGAESSRTFHSDLIGTQYQSQSLTVKVSPAAFDPTSWTVSPCTAVDPGPQPTASVVPTPTTPAVPSPTTVPPANSFVLTSANRACADQRFRATWTGSNLTSVEFALSNTSDNWTSGWLTADPASGAFAAPVDHHGYDKVMARATFTDGTTAQQDADVGTCTEAPAPQPTAPPSKPAPSQPGGATSLPKTGAGVVDSGTMLIASVLLAATFIAGVGLRKRSQP